MSQEYNQDRKLFFQVKELIKVLRFLQNDTVFCEGVTFTQFTILDLVAEKETLELARLHNLLSVEKSTTTRLVNPLVEHNLLKKTGSLNDSRAINLVITKQGKEIHQRVWNCVSGFMESIMNNIPEDKTEDIFNSLQIFTKACGNCCSGTKNT